MPALDIVSNYDINDIEMAKNFTANTKYIIIIPTNDLEELNTQWSQYSALPVDCKIDSDAKSIQIFGMSNEEHYSKLKNMLTNDDNEEDIHYYDGCRVVNISEATRKIKEDLIVKHDVYDIPNLPYFTPDEINGFKFCNDNIKNGELKNNILVGTDVYIKTWFAEYSVFSKEFQSLIPAWIDTVSNICHLREQAKNNNESLEEYDKTLISLGWNPEIKFTIENRIKATDRCKRIIKESLPVVYNMNKVFNDTPDDISLEENNNEDLNDRVPVFMVLKGGNNIFNKITKLYTKSNWCHAAICFNPYLKTLYSFNMDSDGFALEAIKDIKGLTRDIWQSPDKIAVFLIYITKSDMEEINKILKDLGKKKHSTSYGYRTIASILTNKNLNRDDLSLTCSQFVDTLLKLCKMDITHKDSIFVTPADLYTGAINNTGNTIYLVHEGPPNEYKPSKTIKLMNLIQSQRAKSLEEQVVLETIRDMLPRSVEFDKQGDLLIRGPIDYDREYNKAHKLLLEHHKSNNIEGMKYQLCVLFYLLLRIEESLHRKKDKKLIDCRARILNDYNKYMKIVLDNEPDFNFDKYYSNTKYGQDKIRIKGTTLKHSIGLLKALL